MQIQKFSKEESNNKAEQILWDEFLTQYHECQYQSTLKQVSPCAKRQSREYLRESIGNTGYGRDSRIGIQHKHNAEAVNEHCKYQSQFSTTG